MPARILHWGATLKLMGALQGGPVSLCKDPVPHLTRPTPSFIRTSVSSWSHSAPCGLTHYCHCSVWCPHFLRFDQWEPLRDAFDFLTHVHQFLSASLLSGIRYSKLMLYYLCSSSVIDYFSRSPGSLEAKIWEQSVPKAIGVSLLWGPLSGQVIYVHVCLYTHLRLLWFLSLYRETWVLGSIAGFIPVFSLRICNFFFSPGEVWLSSSFAYLLIVQSPCGISAPRLGSCALCQAVPVPPVDILLTLLRLHPPDCFTPRCGDTLCKRPPQPLFRCPSPLCPPLGSPPVPTWPFTRDCWAPPTRTDHSST